MKWKRIWIAASVTPLCVLPVVSCQQQNKLDAYKTKNDLQVKLIEIAKKLPEDKHDQALKLITEVETIEQYDDVALQLKVMIKQSKTQINKEQYLKEIKELKNLSSEEKEEYSKEISKSLSINKINEILSKAKYRDNLLIKRYADKPNQNKTFQDLLGVKPQNKDFKYWGDTKFTKDIKMDNVSYADELASVKPIAPFNTAAKHSNVMYQLTVYSFADGNNDGIGDFIGLKNKLDYFVNLGIDTLYLSPIFPASSYHGYDVIDYTDVAPELGGMEAFDQFLIAAHQNGIRVILDVPFNHTSYEHPWFQRALQGDKKYQDYYNFYKVDSDNKLNSEARDEKYLKPLFTHIKQDVPLSPLAWTAKFWAGMPDLNMDNQDVRKEILNVHQFWTTKGVDGFRYDAFYHIYDTYNPHKPKDDSAHSKSKKLFKEWRDAANTGLKARANQHIASSSDNVLMFGEWWNNPMQAESYFKNLNSQALGTVIDGENYKDKQYVNQDKIVNYVGITADDEKNLINNLNKYNAEWIPFIDNHDVDRWINKVRWANNSSEVTSAPTKLNQFEIDAYNYALVSLLSRGGLPTLYDGNELYMIGGPKNGLGNGDYNIRESYNWANTNDTVYFHEYKSGDLIAKRASSKMPVIEKMIQDPQSGYNIVATINKLRQEYPALREQKAKYIVNPKELFTGLNELNEKMLTIRQNDNGSFIVFVYGYENTGSLNGITLKNEFKVQKTFLSSNIEINNNNFKNTSLGFYGVYLISK
ncbi:alpha-amylase family glycosyl hydrolase [Mycoplasma hafezii]|uniref:alpha-amylase family glycosyl hydrolase n=1 Tax=Mycoplasma hafezii TaxID=525886 RepID=UPI003CED7E7C